MIFIKLLCIHINKINFNKNCRVILNLVNIICYSYDTISLDNHTIESLEFKLNGGIVDKSKSIKAGFLLSGEHEELPFAELKVLLEVYEINTNNIDTFGNYCVLEGNFTPEIIEKIIKRGGYLNEGHLVLLEHQINGNNNEWLKDFYRKVEDLEIPLSHEDSFAVRVLKLDKESKINSMDVEKELGRIVKDKTDSKVNLKNPLKVVRVVVLKDRIYLALILEKRDREYFQKNRPHLRAYFHPGCILPKLARCLVNLSRLKEGDTLLDPFCGTGGFLIEGGFMGLKLIGSDIDDNMVNGTLLNLKSYNLTGHIISIKKWNAGDIQSFLEQLNIKHVDGIVTDPPYGISTSAKGNVEEILNNLENVLKKDGYLVFASSRKINLDLELMEMYELYIHKSLTRYIHVYKKTDHGD